MDCPRRSSSGRGPHASPVIKSGEHEASLVADRLSRDGAREGSRCRRVQTHLLRQMRHDRDPYGFERPRSRRKPAVRRADDEASPFACRGRAAPEWLVARQRPARRDDLAMTADLEPAPVSRSIPIGVSSPPRHSGMVSPAATSHGFRWAPGPLDVLDAGTGGATVAASVASRQLGAIDACFDEASTSTRPGPAGLDLAKMTRSIAGWIPRSASPHDA